MFVVAVDSVCIRNVVPFQILLRIIAVLVEIAIVRVETAIVQGPETDAAVGASADHYILGRFITTT